MFSVIIPTRNRIGELHRALLSLQTQTYSNFEAIVVDDGGNAGGKVVGWMQDSKFRHIALKEHSQRIVARNRGMEEARREWLCWLDDDDEYTSHYLEVVSQAIRDYPGAKCFNFGAIVHHSRNTEAGARYIGTSIRKTFKPEWLGDRHGEFKSGKIGTGSFVFHRDVLGEVEPLPETMSPYDFRNMATDIHHLYPPGGATMGNPWGDDWLMFYRITRKFQSIPLDAALYVQHVRV
jgi:glycosyltransferase involved in cell wall biosynthesis